MHFTSLHLRAYGHFTDKTLDFCDPSSRLWILTGANEAGKSTALAAITDFLFGFNQRTPYDFKHESAKLLVIATLANDRGELLTASRRKGNKDTLKDLQNQPIDQSRLFSFLEGLDRDRFELLYGLDHERLRSGGESVLQGKGEVGTLLFEAGSGLSGIRSVLDRVRMDAESIFKPRGHTKLLNTIRDQLLETRQRLQQQSLSQEQWLGHIQQQEKLRSQLETNAKTLREKQQQENHWRRIETIGPIVARLEHYRRQQLELKDTPSLTVELIRERAELIKNMGLTSQNLELYQKESLSLEARINALCPEEKLIPQASRINALYREAQVVRDRGKQLPGLEFKLTGVNQKQTDLWREVGGTSAEIDEEKLPDSPRLATLRKLMEDRPQLQSLGNELALGIKDLQEEAREKQEEMQVLGEGVDIGASRGRLPGLKELMQREMEATRAFDNSENARKSAEEKRRNLPLWRGSMAELEGCHPPSEDMMQRFIRDFQRGQEAQLKIEDALERIGQELRQQHAQRDKLRRDMGGEPPTDAAVGEARSKRDRFWRLICRHGLSGAPTEWGDIDGKWLNPGQSPAATFEMLVAHADQLADGRVREAERLAQWQQREDRIQSLTLQERQDKERANAITAKQEELLKSWRELWLSLGVVQPGTPVEMQGWPGLRSEILRLKSEADSWHEKGVAVRRELSIILEEAQRFVSSLGGPEAVAGEGLAATHDRWEKFFTLLATQAERRATTKKRLADIERRIRTDREKIEKNRQLLLDNDARWKTLLGQFGHAAGMDVEANAEFLDLFKELKNVFHQREDLLARIREITEQRDTFITELQNLAVVLGEEWNSEDPGQPLAWLEKLKVRLDRTLEEFKRRRDHREQWETLQRSQSQCQVTLQTDRMRLKEIQARYGTQDPREMDGVEERSRLKENLERKIIECEGEILNSGEGLTLAQLLAQTQGQNLELAKEELHKLKKEIAERVEEQRALDQALGGEKRELARLTGAGADAAALTRQEYEDTSNELLKHAEHHVHLHVAATLLQRIIVRFQEQNQGPILGQAARFFRELTYGSFDDLKIDVDGGKAWLYGVRPGGQEVRVEGMSAGTRDQLFLALRLGAL
ncbi:MAG: SMC protein, partial [Magnetococcales bacterium]|nr:SMC protein [Magnetococcales bacterium]